VWNGRRGHEVTFPTVGAGASRRGETAIGYRTAALAGDAKAGYGVQVNPAKSETFRTQPGDRVVVLAEA
jgi:hypothetical protein